MNLAAVTLAYNDEGVINGTLKCLQGFVDRHIVLISEKPYYGEAAQPDNTFQICIDNDVEVIKGTWALDNFQRSLGNRLCMGFDWVLTFDSDEMMTRSDLHDFIKFLEKTDADAVAIQPEVYWRTTKYRLRPKPGYTPIIATRPNVKFTHIRNIDHPFVRYDGPAEMHHLSWCAPKDIYKKVINYAHAPDFNGHQWYHNNYKEWKPGDSVLLPDGVFEAEENPLPDELERYL